MSTNDSTGVPQSMRQRRILDVAREHPTASVDKLASMVSSATPQLVEDVLEQHGDPSADDELSTPSDTGVDSGAGPGTDSEIGSNNEAGTESDNEPLMQNGGSDSATLSPDDGTETETEPESEAVDERPPDDTDDTDASYPHVDELTATQREVLDAIAATPTATQREIAERFDVSTATINNRVNSIPGFEWTDRESFVEQLLDEPSADDASTTHSSTDTDAADESTDSDTKSDDEPTDTASSQPPADDESTATEPTQTTDAPSETARAAAGASTGPTDSPAAAQRADYQELTESISALRADIQQLSGRLSALEADGVDKSSAFEDAELVHKVAHACLTSDAVDESEELRILEALLE